MTEVEIFKPIIGYEGLYLIGNFGTLKSCPKYRGKNYSYFLPEKIKKPCDDGAGYLQTSLSKSGVKKRFRIHVLVGLHFVDNSEGKPEVGHLSRDKYNNRYDNLKWMTRLENEQDAWAKGEKRRGVFHQNSKKVAQYSITGQFIKEYENLVFAERETGFCRSVIGRTANGKFLQAYGYKWAFM